MARVTVEDCVQFVDNRFALCILATRRARQLAAGASPLVQTQRNKSAVIGLREGATGEVRFQGGGRAALAHPPPTRGGLAAAPRARRRPGAVSRPGSARARSIGPRDQTRSTAGTAERTLFHFT